LYLYLRQSVASGAGVLVEAIGLRKEFFVACVVSALPVIPLYTLGNHGILGGLGQARNVGAKFLQV
jgi:hypothetical protein